MLRNQNDSAKQPAEAKRLFKGCLPGLRARNALCGGQQPYRGGRRCEVGRKVPSSHQPVPATTLLLNLNEICSRPFSPVTPGDLNLIHTPGRYLFIYLFMCSLFTWRPPIPPERPMTSGAAGAPSHYCMGKARKMH